MLAFLLSPPLATVSRGRLGRQGGLPHSGLRAEFLRLDLTANKKGGGLSLSQPSFQEPARFLRESPPWARYHDWCFGCAGNLPARTCRSLSTNCRRSSPGVSPSPSPATIFASSIRTIAISTSILWPPCPSLLPWLLPPRPWTGGSCGLSISETTVGHCLRSGGVALPARCRRLVVALTAAHPRTSSTSTMVARPAN